MAGTGHKQLIDSINRSRFYPELVLHTVEEALAGADPTASLVQLETHFNPHGVHRHITVLALAEDILLVAHLDDQQLDEEGKSIVAHVSVETLRTSQLTNVTVSYTYPQPQEFQPGDSPNEIQIFINWTGSQRIDIGPADCADPSCTANHGYTGVAAREDVVVRVSATADGPQMLEEALAFSRALRAAHLKVK